MMKKILIVLLISLSAAFTAYAEQQAAESGPASAYSETVTEEIVSDEAYIFPEIKPEASIYGGFRYVSHKGSSRADEYEYLHNSVTLGGGLKVFSFPHRLNLQIEENSGKDYLGDLNYTYKDIVLFYGMARSLYHNLDNVTLLRDPAAASADYKINPKDIGIDYGATFRMNTFYLRLKTPDFPFHAYVDGSVIDKKGSQQQRNLLESASSSRSGVRTTQSRDMDYRTTEITAGINSHLRWIEADFSHGEKRFDSGDSKVLYDHYNAYKVSEATVRADGYYGHNFVPDLKGSSNTLKLHTIYTESLSASATLSKINRKNTDSGAKADYFIGYGNLTWVASPKVTVFLKYRHKEIDAETPSSITISDLTGANSYTYTKPYSSTSGSYSTLKTPISSTSDVVTGTVRYRPLAGLTLRADYTYEDIDRKDTGEWDGVPQNTSRNSLALSADMRLVKNVGLKAKFIHRDTDSPSTNVDSEHSNEGKISVSWTPLPQLSGQLTYNISKEKNNGIVIPGVEAATHRDVDRDRLLGSVTYLPCKNLSVTASYFYMHHKTVQGIGIGTIGMTSELVAPNTITSRSYLLDATYMPHERITLTGGMNVTYSRGRFSANDPDSFLTAPTDVASYSELKTKETVFSASGEYRFKGGFSAGVQYKYSNFKDVLDNPNDDVSNGRAHIVLLTLSKKW